MSEEILARKRKRSNGNSLGVATLTNGPQTALDFLTGGGEMGARIRARDWAQTPLGPVDKWPQSLRSAVSICIGSAFPIAIYWGADLVLVYNDAWSPILGDKHTWALGRNAREVWPEIWDTIGPLFAHAMTTGDATRSKDGLLAMHRHGFIEECYFDYTFTPVRGEGGKIEGIFNAVLETTERVIGERRLKTLRDLGSRTLEEVKTVQQACRAAAITLDQNRYDVPFALIYLLNATGQTAYLLEAVGLERKSAATPKSVNLQSASDVWDFSRVLATNRSQVIDTIADKFGRLTAGAWADDFTRQASVLPLAKAGIQDFPAGFLVAGISPRIRFGENYHSFLELTAGHVATAIANGRALEGERKRAEVLAELDRAKTKFFSNVSHEFRTPLTLMLGPVEDALADSGTIAPNRERMEVIHRNSLRLLKLVNTLLDFSRIEAGRSQAAYQPTDLSLLTEELSSVFRSAVERAGLRLVVKCPKLPEPVFVDREMWEKIVFNLLSNSFKSTFEGEITIKLHNKKDHVELVVQDTGTGIPEDEIPHLFERFRRVEGARRRTYEGSGIGLALLQEMVKMHGGSVAVESAVGRGTTFRVSIPYGTSHLPTKKIIKAGQSAYDPRRATAYVQELLSWLPEHGEDGVADDLISGTLESVESKSAAAEPGTRSARVLVVDDNHDMREYLQRLLSQRFEVASAENGRIALKSALKLNPDLVLTDVMMPEMDGFQLLAALRQHSATKTVPVIMLSARAGEESRLEGFEAGADDYLVKPFTARELLTRVESHINIAKFRANALAREHELEKQVEQSHQLVAEAVENIHDGFITLDSDWRFTSVNPAAESMSQSGKDKMIGKTLWEVFPDVKNTELERRYRAAMQQRTRDAFEFFFEPWQRWYSLRVSPAPDGGLAIYCAEITAQKRAQDALRLKEEHLRLTQQAAKIGSWELDVDEEEITISSEFAEAIGLPSYVSRLKYTDFLSTLFFSSDRTALERAMTKTLRADKELNVEARLRRPDGTGRLVSLRGKSFHNQGRPIVLGVLIDLTNADSLRRSKQRSSQRSRKAS